MRHFGHISLLAFVGACSAIEISSLSNYLGYLATQGKSYQTLNDFTERLANFNEIDTWIRNYNSDPEMTAKMAHNKFSDWSNKERSQMTGQGIVNYTDRTSQK